MEGINDINYKYDFFRLIVVHYQGTVLLQENRPDILFHYCTNCFSFSFTDCFLFNMFLRRLRSILFQRASLCVLNGLIQMRGRTAANESVAKRDSVAPRRTTDNFDMATSPACWGNIAVENVTGRPAGSSRAPDYAQNSINTFLIAGSFIKSSRKSVLNKE